MLRAFGLWGLMFLAFSVLGFKAFRAFVALGLQGFRVLGSSVFASVLSAPFLLWSCCFFAVASRAWGFRL